MVFIYSNNKLLEKEIKKMKSYLQLHQKRIKYLVIGVIKK